VPSTEPEAIEACMGLSKTQELDIRFGSLHPVHRSNPMNTGVSRSLRRFRRTL